DSLPARIAQYQRRKMFRAFMAFAAARPQDTILDVGVTSDRSYDHSNYFAAWYPHKAAITAAGLDDASFMSTLYPGLRFIRGDLRVRVPIRHMAALGTLAVLGFLWLGRGLPDTAWLASDSASYLDFSPVRPHGYAAFLAAYRLLFDDFAHLPAVQLGCYVAAVWLLGIGIALRTQNFIAAATTLIVALWLTDTTGFPYVLSDSLYAALLIAAAACFLF